MAKLGWNTGLMPEKIMALGTFHGTLLDKLHKDQNVVKRITQSGAGIISKYFDTYVDAIARIDPYRYHHIYEFGMTGNKSARLFKSTVKNGIISYSLLPASVPNQNGQIFQQKAFIMEEGTPIIIEPTNSNILAFEIDGESVFTNKSVVMNPGGKFVKNAFKEIFDEFFNSNMPDKALKEFGFYSEIEQGIVNESGKIISQISAGKIKGTAMSAANAAYGIAGKVEGRGNRL